MNDLVDQSKFGGYLKPMWNAPANVHACTTFRAGGFSASPYDSFNLADHVGDDPDAVIKNRIKLQKDLSLQQQPLWLKQVHGIEVINWNENLVKQTEYEADASFTQLKHHPCVALTADCLPVVICDQKGTIVAAVHAGWKGILSGVIEAAIKKMGIPGESLMAWMGPAIGPEAFEVDEDVRDKFINIEQQAEIAFKPGKPGKWFGDIFLLGKQQLNRMGVHSVFGGYHCTYKLADQFFSARRDKETGRMATLIWMT